MAVSSRYLSEKERTDIVIFFCLFRSGSQRRMGGVRRGNGYELC